MICFLVASKAHGRQMRLERELAGYFHVRFGGENPAFVESLWSRERIIFWSVVVALVGVSIAFRRIKPIRGVPAILSFHAIYPMTFAFIAAGLLSFARYVGAGGDALLGSVGWFLASLILSITSYAWMRRMFMRSE